MDAELLSGVGAIASALVAIAAGAVAWNSARATDALRKIEHTRLQAELWPQLNPEGSIIRFAGSIDMYVKIEFLGPPALHRLDRVDISIRHPYAVEPHGRAAEVPNTRQDYAFNGDPNPDRIVNLGDMVLGDSRALIINPVGDGIDLGEDYPPPLRLIIKCWAMGYEPWIVPMTINQFERYG